jgi:uncharacterized protein
MAGFGQLIRYFLRINLLLAALSQVACAQSDAPMILPIDKTPLTVMTVQGLTSIQIEVARTPRERSRGLMFRDKLPDGQGMFFVFDEPDFQNFWMKDTPAALDIIYIAADGQLVSIQKGEPLSTNPIPSAGPAQFVLELAFGQADKLGLKVGDVFSHPLLNTTSK